MRRGSIIGPVILIFIGVVFLLRNVRPDIPLMEWLETYWPLLLVVWGGVRLVEIAYWHFADKTLPNAGVSGGEWALIVALAVVGSAVWGTQELVRDHFGQIQIGGVEMFGESYDYDAGASVTPTGKTPHVVIDNSKGSVRIVGTAANEVKVTGRKNVRAIDRASADRSNTAAQVQVGKSGETITVTARTNGMQESARVTMDLEINVPAGATIEARGQNGDFDVSDVNGEVTIYSDNAGVRAQNLGGRVKVETRRSDIIRATGVKGDIEIKGRGRDIELEDVLGQVSINGSYSGETTLRNIAKEVRFDSNVTQVKLERVPGELQLGLSTLTGTNLVGPMIVKTETKDIRLTDVSESLAVNVESGDFELTQTRLPLPRIDVEVQRSGDVELALPNAKCTVNAQTNHGELNNDLDDRIKQSTEGDGGRLAGSLGGTTEVKAMTRRGSITLRRSGAGVPEAAPPAPAKPPKAPKAPRTGVSAPQKVTN
jgi:hypothetical protein